MSYDLMVFDPDHAPRDRAGFLEWYEAQSEWAEEHAYDDPAVSTPRLRAWFFDAIRTFPAMNGPHATDDDDDSALTDYCVGTHVIYAGYAWSVAERARDLAFDLAGKHGLGLFEVSAEDSPAWRPAGEDGFEELRDG